MPELRHSIAIHLIAVLLALASAGAMAAPLSENVQWKDPSSVDLKVDFPGDGYHADWELFRCKCGDLLIRSELVVPGEVTHGDILLVANRAVLLRGYDPGAAEQISFDGPALMMQLVLRLLERAEPAGPAAITGRREVAVEDKINYINLDTGDAAGSFPPPWKVTGVIWPQAESQRRFDLTFTFNAPGAAGEQQQSQMKLSGVAEYAPAEFPLAEDMALDEWKLSWRDEKDEAIKKAGAAKTLSDLRQLLKSK